MEATYRSIAPWLFRYSTSCTRSDGVPTGLATDGSALRGVVSSPARTMAVRIVNVRRAACRGHRPGSGFGRVTTSAETDGQSLHHAFSPEKGHESGKVEIRLTVSSAARRQIGP